VPPEPPEPPAPDVYVLTYRSAKVMFFMGVIIITIWGWSNVRRNVVILERLEKLHEKVDALK
jgi:hypothetical protein